MNDGKPSAALVEKINAFTQQMNSLQGAAMEDGDLDSAVRRQMEELINEALMSEIMEGDRLVSLSKHLALLDLARVTLTFAAAAEATGDPEVVARMVQETKANLGLVFGYIKRLNGETR